MPQHADVVICGAGIAGVAAAFYLATQQQIGDVIIIDKLPPLSLTSAKSGENFRNWWPNPIMVDLMNRSIDLMEELASATGNLFHMERRGYAYVTADTDFPRHLDGYLRPYRQSGLDGICMRTDETGNYVFPSARNEDQPRHDADVLLSRTLTRDAFPHLTPAVQGVVHARRGGAISAHQLGMHLLAGAKQRGLRELRGEVVGVERDGQGVSAVRVETASGPRRIETRVFINAAGPFIADLAAMLDVALPVFSVFQQKIAFRDHLGVVPRDAPFTIFMDRQQLDWDADEREFITADPDLHWLLAEFPGGVHVKPEGSGDSDWIKLGWAYNQTAETPRWTRAGASEFPEIMVRGASRMIPGLRQYTGRLPSSFAHYGGYYTKTRENMPLIGPLAQAGETVPGAYILGALSGFGTMAACAAGELLAAWVGGTTLPTYARTLSLTRDGATQAWGNRAGQGEL